MQVIDWLSPLYADGVVSNRFGRVSEKSGPAPPIRTVPLLNHKYLHILGLNTRFQEPIVLGRVLRLDATAMHQIPDVEVREGQQHSKMTLVGNDSPHS